MWDNQIVRRDPGQVAKALGRRGTTGPVAELSALLSRRQALGQQVEELNRERNLTARDGKDGAERGRTLREQTTIVQQQLNEVEASVRGMELLLPNRPHESVPDGHTSVENVVIHTWGTPREFPVGAPAKDHVELGESLGILDLPTGVKLAGAGYPVFLGDLARLNRAGKNFMLETHRERGYEEITVPFVATAACLEGTGQMPKFRDDLFWTEDGLGLIPTAEVPLTNLFRERILNEQELPKRVTAYSPCFRREAGSYGRDTRGLIRLHQFEKTELVRVAVREDSYRHLEEMTDDAEEVLRRLELPYRRVALCAGDLGFSAAKTYDLEVWLPSLGCYREISSVSNCEDFQARRMNLRVRRANGKTEFAHTLNGSGLAIGRTLVAILENYQRPDGSVEIPAALVPYMGGQRVIEAR